jgi:4'-phosphopantetheinyl transferase EntD
MDEAQSMSSPNTHQKTPPERGDTLIQPLFDLRCVTEEAVPALVDEELFAEEQAFISRAVPKRRAEFGTARVCARRALARMGIAPVALVPEDDRAPRWPTGVVGSISHTHGYCAVVVAQSAHYASVGLDAEQDRELAPDLVNLICTARERHVLRANPEAAVLYFAAKEAFYKCQYPLTKTFLDFQDVELDVDFSQGTFRSTVIKPFPARPDWIDHMPGRFIRSDGLWLCSVTLDESAQTRNRAHH